MKIIGLSLLIFLLSVFKLMAQTVSIPDTAFLSALIELGVDTNGDGVISYTEAGETNALWISDRDIFDLSGIEAFVNLDTLDCERNQLDTIDLSSNTSLVFLNVFLNKLSILDISENILLEEVHCDYNPLTNLDVAKNVELKILSCSGGKLVSLDLSENKLLEELNCRSNDLSILELPGNSSIRDLFCDFNELNELDISSEASLESLECRSNQLTQLDLSNNPVLKVLHCDFNLLSTLDISKNPGLKLLHVDSNQLESLILNDTALISVDCDYNKLESLDVSACTSLEVLNCSSNKLGVLDVSNNTMLNTLQCGDNTISSLNLDINTVLTTLNCSSNGLNSLDLSKNTLLTHVYIEGNEIAEMDFSNNTVLQILQCRGNQMISLDFTENPELIELYCEENKLSALSINNNPALRLLSCSYNPLTNLDISNLTDFFKQDGTCGCGGYLDISNIPSLSEVCVWVAPFPQPDSIWTIFTQGSPDISFKDCLAPTLSIFSEVPYQPESIEVRSSEDGNIYLVPENTNGKLEDILADSLMSVPVFTNTSVNISLEGLNNGTYWLYGADQYDNISSPEEFAILGVGFEEVADNHVEIYPNPVNDILTINSNDLSAQSIKLIALNGEVLSSFTYNGGSTQLDLSSFEKGVYFVKIISKERITSRKVIKL